MRLADFNQVEGLVLARRHVSTLVTSGHIEITVDGHHQSREFVDVVGPAVRLELRHKLGEIDEKLFELGVRID